MIKTHKIKLYPNATMRKELEKLFDYRRFVWNQGLEIWNDMYDASLVMSEKFVMNWLRTKQIGSLNDRRAFYSLP